MPIAGDQGAGLGIYQGVHGDLKWPGHVYWGKRNGDICNDKKLIDAGIMTFKAEDNATDFVKDEIRHKSMVNVVRGAMEFGPRALCHTSTLAKPTNSSVDVINNMNDRTTIMPMAPVMTEDQAMSLLKLGDPNKKLVVGSLEYMITTLEVKEEKSHEIEGAVHTYDGYSTCRPQITYDQFMCDLLNVTGPLINTSFNYHGVPIVFTNEQIIDSHLKQNQNGIISTVVIQGEEE